MAYIIDGHNLIPKIPNLSLKAIDDEIELIKILKTFCKGKGRKVEVFFDKAPPGQSRTQKYGSITAHFVMHGVTADRAILKYLKSLGKAARNTTVVSSDNQVRNGARAMGAKVLSSEEFSSLLLTSNTRNEEIPDDDPGASPEPKVDEAEIDQLLELFTKNKDEDE